MKISENGLNLIKKYEGFSSKPYKDAVGVNTIGYGNTYYPDGHKVKLTDKPVDKTEASLILGLIVDRDFAAKVDKLVKVDIGQNMFDALVSFAYNVGIGNFQSSTLLKKVNVMDFGGAAEEFKKWVKAGNKVLPGLVTRRKEEAELFGRDLK